MQSLQEPLLSLAGNDDKAVADQQPEAGARSTFSKIGEKFKRALMSGVAYTMFLKVVSLLPLEKGKQAKSWVMDDKARQTLLINFALTFLFYKQVFADMPAAWHFFSARHHVYGSLILLSIFVSPAVHHQAFDLKTILLMKPALQVIKLVKEYRILVTRGGSEEFFRGNARVTCYDGDDLVWVNKQIQRIIHLSDELSGFLASEKLATMLLLMIELLAAILYKFSGLESAIKISILSVLVNVVRYEWQAASTGNRCTSFPTERLQVYRLRLQDSLLGQTAHRIHIKRDDFAEHGLLVFPIVMGTLEISDKKDAILFMMILLSIGDTLKVAQKSALDRDDDIRRE